MGSTNANSFPDGRRGRARSGDTSRVAEYAASTLPVRGPGLVGRRLPGGSIVRALPVRRGRGSAVATPPLSVVDASGPDSTGTTHPGRVRMYKGRIGGLLPTNMQVVDALLPGGTDNRCYLTLANGINFVYGKVLVNAADATFTSALVYPVQEEEGLDGDYVYLLIAEVTFDETGVHLVEQLVTGNQKLRVYSSPDGTILVPDWEVQT